MSLVKWSSGSVPSRSVEETLYLRITHVVYQVITIIGLIITGIVITAGGGPNHETIGFRYWNETGGFVQYAGIGEEA